MHQHLRPQQWALAFGDMEDAPGRQLCTCPRCGPSRGNLQAWLTAVERCPQCSMALEEYEPLPKAALECNECLAAYEVFDGWLEELEHFEPQVAPEWVVARDLFQKELAHLPFEESLVQVQSHLAYQSWGFCQRLLADSLEARLTDPLRSHARSALAAAVADRLNEMEYRPQWVADLRAKAHAYHGNSLRLLGEYAHAESEFVQAEAWVERGLGQGRAEATVLSLKASLLLDQCRHLEAEAVLERVERHYREHQQNGDVAKALLQLAMVSRARDLHGQAVERVERALTVLGRDGETALRSLAQHNLVHYLIGNHEVRKARTVFDELPEIRDHLPRLRRKWLAGDLLRAEGALDEAARKYDETRVEYLAEELYYIVALVSLDLAIVAVEQQRHDAVRELARDAVVLLTRAGAPQEAFAAMRLLIDSLEQKAVTAAFIQEIARKLARLQPSQ